MAEQKGPAYEPLVERPIAPSPEHPPSYHAPTYQPQAGYPQQQQQQQPQAYPPPHLQTGYQPAAPYAPPPMQTTVISTQPASTAYVSPGGGSGDAHLVLPMVGLIVTILQISISLVCLNVLAIFCLVPPLICAIVGLAAQPARAKTMGMMSIIYNVAHLVVWFVIVVIICISVPIALASGAARSRSGSYYSHYYN